LKEVFLQRQQRHHQQQDQLQQLQQQLQARCHTLLSGFLLIRLRLFTDRFYQLFGKMLSDQPLFYIFNNRLHARCSRIRRKGL